MAAQCVRVAVIAGADAHCAAAAGTVDAFIAANVRRKTSLISMAQLRHCGVLRCYGFRELVSRMPLLLLVSTCGNGAPARGWNGRRICAWPRVGRLVSPSHDRARSSSQST